MTYKRMNKRRKKQRSDSMDEVFTDEYGEELSLEEFENAKGDDNDE